ncbi:IclR family transcriptional regulator [Okibacterium endophyticum]
MSTTSGYRERNSTADRTLSILQMFDEDSAEITAVEVAAALGVARSTAYRYLETFVQARFLVETGRGGFRLGTRILELAKIARDGRGLSELSVPVMRDLAEHLRQTVLLTRLSGESVVCVEREEAGGQYVRLSYERGSVLPVHAGASAHVLLAWFSEQRVRSLLRSVPLPRYTDRTLTDPDEIVQRLASIRAAGYAVSEGEVDSSATGVAAPIFGPDGEVVAGLSVVLIRPLVPADQVRNIVEAVVTAADSLTKELAVLQA